MHTSLHQRAVDYFESRLGVSLDALLAPISPAQPAGIALRGGADYSRISIARRQDDASLPYGVWERELKRADWDQVSRIAIDALRIRGKDMQTVAWLLEAQIHQHGFAGVAPVLYLLEQLCEQFWDQLHPDGQECIEHRANILHWIDQKLLAPLRRVPLSAQGAALAFTYADVEQARRGEQLLAAGGHADLEGPTTAELALAARATTAGDFAARDQDLEAAIAAALQLQAALAPGLSDDARCLDTLIGLLDRIREQLRAPGWR